MQGLDAILPPLATELAERLLLTPMRHRTPARERPLLETARVRTLKWGPNGETLRGNAWGAGPTVLLVHGWAGRATQLGAFIAPIVAAGYSVLAFDMPAHGRSDGEQASLFDFRDALLAIGRAHGPLAGVIAHSMGAAASSLAIAGGLKADRFVAIASPASLRDQTQRFARTLGLSERTFARVAARLERRLHATLDSVELEHLAPHLTLPTLVIHDVDDAEVLVEDGARIAASLPQARLLRTSGLGHHRILRAPEVLDDVSIFLTGRRPHPADLAPIGTEELIDRELFDPACR
jgi:pimeloyl-ACP methyl ester carboxylesterase